MRKFAILLGLVVSLLVLTGCANKVVDQGPMVDSASSQQDFKGEHKAK